MKTKVLLLMFGLLLGSAFLMKANAQRRYWGGRHWGGYYGPAVVFRPRVIAGPAPIYYAPVRRHFWVGGFWAVDAWGRS